MFSVFIIESPPLMSPASVEDALGVTVLSFTTFLIFKAALFAAEATQQVSCFASCGCNFQHLHLQFSEFSLFLCFCNICTTFMCTICATFINDLILGVWKIHIIKNKNTRAAVVFTPKVKGQTSCCCVFLLHSVSPGTKEFPVPIFVF